MKVAEAFELITGRDSPVEIVAYDGSRTGPVDAPVRVEVRSPRALSYLATAPGDIGLARAYVVGDLEVMGDLYTAMASVVNLDLNLDWRTRLRVLRGLGGVRL